MNRTARLLVFGVGAVPLAVLLIFADFWLPAFGGAVHPYRDRAVAGSLALATSCLRRRKLSISSRRAMAKAQGSTSAPRRKRPRAQWICSIVCCSRSSAREVSRVWRIRNCCSRGASAS